jgi:hypothetical protein
MLFVDSGPKRPVSSNRRKASANRAFQVVASSLEQLPTFLVVHMAANKSQDTFTMFKSLLAQRTIIFVARVRACL